MKIERISENQIRCTLSKRDLIERHLKISELAYGSERAKQLFRDMMEQANMDFGFDVDDIPLMIEAIPTSRESLVLVITKVTNPQEFDEKFGDFNISDDDIIDDDYDVEDVSDYIESIDGQSVPASDIVNCFEQLHDLLESAASTGDGNQFIPFSEALQSGKTKKKSSKQSGKEELNDKIKVYTFSSMNPIIDAAPYVIGDYSGKNTLWKDDKEGRYLLMLNKGHSKTAFRSVCSVFSEYGHEESVTYATQDYFNEHYKLIIRDKALQQLAKISVV